MNNKIDCQMLMDKAKEVSKNAYAPYSDFRVGACALYDSGNTYTGCNVENASYGLSLCAERNAISTAIASGEKGKLTAVAVYSPASKDCTPCGACRQWLFEFVNGQELNIITEGDDSGCIFYKITDLLPHGFNLQTSR